MELSNDRLIELYESGRLTMPKPSQDKLIQLCQDGGISDAFAMEVFQCEDINQPDQQGRLPVNEMLKANASPGNIEFLCEQGRPCLDPRIKDAQGRSALDIAKKMDNEKYLEILEDQVGTYEWWSEDQEKRKNMAKNSEES